MKTPKKGKDWNLSGGQHYVTFIDTIYVYPFNLFLPEIVNSVYSYNLLLESNAQEKN